MNKSDTIKLEVFTDYVCPWCYLATASLARLRQHYPVEITLLPFPLHPDTPEAGLSLNELFQGRDLREVHERLYRMMDEAGLEYGERSMTYNSRLAQELGKWADTQAGGAALHDAFYRAYFVQEQNLARPQVLLDVVEQTGLDRSAAEKVLNERTFRAAVDADWQRARSYQISGVPSFVSNNYVITGCQPYEELERFVNYLAQLQAQA